MKVNNILERAEKYRGLGRFDKRSAITFLNDALYEISKSQSLKIEEIFYSYIGQPIELENKIIKVDTIELKGVDSKDFQARVMQNNTIVLYKKNEEKEFVKIRLDDNVKIPSIIIEYTGHVIVKDVEDDIDFPSEFENAIVYFIRAKMLEEIGEIEQSQYFTNQYLKEIISKSAPKVNVVSKPSQYSLL